MIVSAPAGPAGLDAGTLKSAIADALSTQVDEIDLGRAPSTYGVDSLVAMEIKERLFLKHGVLIDADRILAADKWLDIVDFIQPVTESHTPNQEVQVEEIGSTQGALMVQSVLDRNSSARHLCVAFRWDFDADEDGIRRAVEVIQEVHPELNALFSLDSNGRPVKRYAKKGHDECVVVHTKTCLDSEKDLAEQLQIAVDAPMDMAAGPLFRLEWFPDAAGRHLYLFLAHHAIMDLWSFSVLLDDFVLLMTGSDLDPQSRASAPFSAHVKRQLNRFPAIRERSLEYWSRHFARPPSRMSFDGVPNTGTSGRTARRHGFAFDARLTTSLSARAKDLGVTLNSVLLAIHVLTLARFAGQSGVVVGLPVAGRQSLEFSRTVGCFINTLALNFRTDQDIDLNEFAAVVHKEVRAAQSNQGIPYHQLIRLLHEKPGYGNLTDIQSIFVLQRVPKLPGAEALVLGIEEERCSIRGHVIAPVAVAPSEAPFDIGLMMVECAGRLHGRYEFRSEAVSAELVAGMAEHLAHVAECMVSEPPPKLNQIDGLTTRIRAEWRERCRGATAVFPGEESVFARFKEVARSRPNQVAVIVGTSEYRYDGIASRAETLGARLSQAGVAPERRVVVMTERSVETVVAMLAVWRCGGVYVPIAEEAPPDRIGQIFADCRPDAVLATAATAHRVPKAWRAAVIRMDGRETGSGHGLPPAETPVDGSNLAYVIYTSGSEGVPKGVMVTYAGAVNFALSQASLLDVDAEHRILQIASFGFDASMSDVLMALLLGGTLVVATSAQRLPGKEFTNLVRESQIHLITAAASMLDAVEVPDFEDLRTVISTAEACTESIVRRWGRRFGLYNGYGPTEVSIGATIGKCAPARVSAFRRAPGIGRPFHNYSVYVLDEAMQPAPYGVCGEIYVGGKGVARGYYNDSRKTAAAFLPDPFATAPGSRMYRTGDYGLLRADGEFEFIGRRDHQINVRGHRVELAEIERALRALPGVKNAAVVARASEGREPEMLACIEPAEGFALKTTSLRHQLRGSLPDYMCPSFIGIETVPINASGKVDRPALRERLEHLSARRSLSHKDKMGDYERRVAAIWQRILGHDEFSLADNFFDAGGHSLALVRVQAEVSTEFGNEVTMTELLQYCTVTDLAAYLSGSGRKPLTEAPLPEIGGVHPQPSTDSKQKPVAIVGMACRFPGANDRQAFWDNLMEKRCAVRFFTREELLRAGVPSELVELPNYVPARAVLEEPYAFDARLFGCSEREAELLDPQRRLLLECCFEALQEAGLDDVSVRERLSIGTYLSASESSYFNHFIRGNAALERVHGGMRLAVAADKSFVATYIAYKLHLAGPAITIDSACSSSLVAVHEACRSIRTGDCEVAIAGGMSVDCPQPGGHVYEQSGIGSRDGYCRPFDADATGTVKGMGGGVVVLKDLARARKDGDIVLGVIHGSATNNDAGRSVGFTAPSVSGQVDVIRKALRSACVSPNEIGLIEAHGTGTPLGDPIEFAALREIFAGVRSRKISIGSVKSNIGHLDAAAGIAGLIKVVLSLWHGSYPPTLHFRTPNPELSLSDDALTFASESVPLSEKENVPYAGVSSFGIGGTNCHVVVGRGDVHEPAERLTRERVFFLSAHTEAALRNYCLKLADSIEREEQPDLAGIAYTLSSQRAQRDYRIALVARDPDDLVLQLRSAATQAVVPAHTREVRHLVFVFPGQAGQEPGMARELHSHESAYRDNLDRMLSYFENDVGAVCKEWLLRGPEAGPTRAVSTLPTTYLQPALFCHQLALCRYLESLGIEPNSLIGYSLGEWVAAVVAGTLNEAIAATLIQTRARLMGECNHGSMLVVRQSGDAIQERLPSDLEIAVYAGSEECVVTGPSAEIGRFSRELKADGLDVAPIETEHAFHSSALDPVLADFSRELAIHEFSDYRIPWLSNLTGDWILQDQARSAEYWVQQMRCPVQFESGVRRLLENPNATFVVIGEGGGLRRLIRTHASFAGQTVVSMSRTAKRNATGGLVEIQRAIADLWVSGVDFNWDDYFDANKNLRRRAVLPAYCFDRMRFSIEGTQQPVAGNGVVHKAEVPDPTVSAANGVADRDSKIAEWLRNAWTELLGPGAADRDSDFFAAGGDSLAVLRLCNQVSKRFQIHITPSKLIEASQFSRMLALLESLIGRMPTPPSKVSALADAVSGEVPSDKGRNASNGIALSFQQQRMLFQHLTEDEPAVLNLPLCVTFDADRDDERLIKAVRMLIKKHPSLRARLAMVDGEMRQFFDRDPDTFALDAADAGDLHAERIVDDVSNLPFDLERDWLLRVAILDSAPGRTRIAISVHHIVCDGYSLALLVRDLLEYYENPDCTVEAGSIVPLQQYIDRQGSWIESGEHQTELEYWVKRLKGATETRLPGAIEPADSGDHRGCTIPVPLPSRLSTQLRTFCAEKGVTPFVAMLAGFKCLLACYASCEDIPIGTPVTERDAAELGSFVGLFVNTMVLRTQVNVDESFSDVCGNVAETVRGGLAHRRVPFNEIVERLRSEGGERARTPLFAAAFVMEGDVGPDQKGAREVCVDIEPVAKRHSQFQLAIWVGHSGGILRVRLEYRRGSFDSEVMEKLAKEFGSFLEKLFTYSSSRVCDLFSRSARQASTESTLVGPTAELLPEHAGLPAMLQEVSIRFPDHAAVHVGDEVTTYRVLTKRAERFAAFLRSVGVVPGDRIGVYLTRSALLPVALYGGWLCGAVMVPLETELPLTRIRQMLDDSGARYLVSAAELPEIDEVADVRRVDIDTLDWDGLPVAVPAVSDPDWPAYLIYTSGSTGAPKGVLCAQRGLLNRLIWMNRSYGFGPEDKFLHKTPISFDVSLWELFCPLLCGASVVMAPPGDHRDPRALRALVEQHAITVIHFVPTMLREYLAATQPHQGPPHVFCSGEGLPAHVLDSARKHLGANVRLVNLYGPTETSIEVSSWEFRGRCGTPIAPLGRPISGVSLYVLDPRMVPVPIGEVGELYIAGDCVALGYWGSPGLTAASFLPDPLAVRAGSRMYRTGDLVRLHPEGNIEFLGRADDQIKICGNRIEPGEIETVLRSIAGVSDAVVISSGSATVDPSLIAYVVPGADCPEREALRRVLVERLPAYMIPGTVTFVDRIPVGPNGKLDRAALPKAVVDRPARSGASGPDVRTLLTDAWCDVLGVAQATPKSEFFADGGSSIKAIRLAGRIEVLTGRRCRIRTIFDHPVLADLAAALEGESEATSDRPSVSLVPSPELKHAPFPMTDLQRAYWAGRSRAFELGNVATHGYLELDVEDLNVEAFRNAVRRLVIKHDALRLVVDDRGRQKVLSDVPLLPIGCVDLSEVSEDEKGARLETIRSEMAHALYNPEEWPMFDFRLARLDKTSTRVFVSIDALLVDGMSIQLLENDLNATYIDALAGANRSVEHSVASDALSYRDYVCALAGLESSDTYQRARNYWLEKIPSMPPAPPLPFACDPATLERPEFKRFSSLVGARNSQRLRRVAAQHNATLSVLLLAAYAEVLSSWSNTTDFSLNLTISDRVRIHPDVDSLVGNLSSLLIVSLDIRPGLSFSQRLASVRDALVQDMQHRIYSGVRVLQQLADHRGDRNAARMPVVFTSLVDGKGTDEAGAVRYFDFSRPHYSVTQTSQTWLDCSVAWVGDRLLVAWDAVSGLFAPGTLEYFHEEYVALLTRLADSSDLADAAQVVLHLDRQHLLSESQSVESSALARGELLHERVLEVAERYPERIAIVTPRRCISFGQLVRSANALAWRLRSAGASLDRPVAVVTRNGWEHVVSCLAVVMSGAPYLPINASTPASRRNRLLKLGETRIILTTEDPHVLSADATEQMVIRVDDSVLECAERERLLVATSSQDLAYVMYTSGSTGAPKGVMIEHRAAVNTVVDINRRFDVNEDDTVLALSDFTFDLSVYDVFGPLSVGGRIVIPEEYQSRDPHAWIRLVHEHGVTLWNSVPTLAQMLIEYLEADRASLTKIRLFLVSGDWIPIALPRRAKERCPAAEFVSLGGATEASIWSILHLVQGSDEERPSIPYGTALTGQSVLVVDPAMRVCPPGVTGEIVIGGAGLARGYWGSPAQTDASFVRHPRTGQRLYLTGDLGRYLPGDLIEFLGRADNQVKIRGHRIELGEIEHHLGRQVGVRSAAVALHKLSDIGPVLVAYLALQENARSADPSSVVREISAAPVCSWSELVSAVETEAHRPRLGIEMSRDDLSRRIAEFNKQYEHALLNLFFRLGMFRGTGERVTTEEVIENGGIAPRYRRWVDRALSHMEATGYLKADGNGWTCRNPLRGAVSAPSLGYDLLAVLSERESSAELYLSESTIVGYQTIFSSCHSMIIAAIEALLGSNEGKALKILEVGAGHGSCTQHVLPLLPKDSAYLFTDVSPYFIGAARERFAGFEFVDYAIFDLDRNPQLQGLELHSYDVVIAASVLHDIKDVSAGIDVLHSLLKPGGMLLMIEETRFVPFFDLGMGLQQGFDVFTDVMLRKEHPLLTREQWKGLLESRGFASSAAINAPDSAADLIGFDVLLARMPDSIRVLDEECLEVMLRAELPAHMIPARFVCLRDMPVTANGKLDRNALPVPTEALDDLRTEYAPPQSPLEIDLVEIWKQVTGRTIVGVNDNFFRLGGDSLVAVQLAMRIREHFRCSFSVRAVFEAPTIRELASLLELATESGVVWERDDLDFDADVVPLRGRL